MKFGLELQENIFPPWRMSYIMYDILKQELKARQLSHPWNVEDEEHFIHLLDSEFTKVYDFTNAKLAEIDARILYCERTIQTLQTKMTVHSDMNYKIMDDMLTDILFDINDLSKFTRINFTAIQKILKKHDKWTGLNLKKDYVDKLRERPLDKQRFDVAIVYISVLHDICRNNGKQSPGNSTAGSSQNAFERATAKYWVHPDNVTEVKAIIMLHLPVLIFNRDKKFESSDSAVSSVYFDNSNFDLYTGRLQRDEMAEAIRFRWYGSNTSNDIYIERKTHHADWLDGASVKDRFQIKESKVNSFISGEYTPSQIIDDLHVKSEKAMKNIDFIATGVQKSFRNKNLKPVLRVFYNRTAFQFPDSQLLRISLDTNLTFIKEHNKGNWRRQDIDIDYPFEHLPEADVLRFPYAILETKIQTHLGQEPPAWLMSLLESHLVHEVPRFSKYLHGACHFHKDSLSLIPWWLSELNVDIRKPRAVNIGLTRSRSYKPLIDGRYRRSIIEERERLKNQAMMLKHMPQLKLEDIENKRRRRSILLDEEAELSLKPLEINTKKTTDSSGIIKYDGCSSSTVVPSVDDLESSKQERSSIFSSKTFYSILKRIAGISELENRKDSLNELEAQRYRKSQVKVEPKTFFANERTFLAWLQFCALLLTVSLNLINFGDSVSRIIGGIFMGLAGIIAIYALCKFEKHAWMIKNQVKGRYDDLWGPSVLCLLLVAALIVNFYLRFKN